MSKVWMLVWVWLLVRRTTAAAFMVPTSFWNTYTHGNTSVGGNTLWNVSTAERRSGLGLLPFSDTHSLPTKLLHKNFEVHEDPLNWKSRLRSDPLERAGLLEGDILPSPNAAMLIPKEKGLQNKIAVRDDIKLWFRAVVPYEFSTGFVLLPVERLIIHHVMDDISSHSCIHFVERTKQEDYLKIIVDRDRCYSHIGRVGGAQVLSLGMMCVTWMDMGPVYHELFHAIGFYHEHNRPDRDNHIEVKWDNIAEDSVKNFIKRDITSVELIDFPYDIDSVMHYSPFTFAKWSFFTPTMKSKEKGYFFWRKSKPSEIDYNKLNRLYSCHREGRGTRFRLGRRRRPPLQLLYNHNRSGFQGSTWKRPTGDSNFYEAFSS